MHHAVGRLTQCLQFTLVQELTLVVVLYSAIVWQVGSHQLNMESSRSHAIFTIYCDATPTGELYSCTCEGFGRD